MFTDGEILSMIATGEEALPETCTVKRRTLASDGAGGKSESWAAVSGLSGIACRIGAVGRSPGAVQIASRMGYENARMVTVAYNRGIQPGDRIEVGSRVLEVVGILDVSWKTVLRCVCKEV